MLFIDEDQGYLIVEIQKAALDRYHLYKCLEYRDLLFAREGGRLPKVTLVCEDLPLRYKSILETHKIDLFLFSSPELIEKAIDHCPNAMKRHLLKSPSLKFQPSELSASRLRRYAWRHSDELFDVLSFALSETKKSQVKNRTLFGESGGGGLLYEARNLLNELRFARDILDPARWNISSLTCKPDGWVRPQEAHITRIRKPEIDTFMYITSKGNLTLRWRPSSREPFRSNNHDWVHTPAEEPYAYERPENELLFIKDIADFSPDPEHHKHYQDCEERAAIGTMMAALIWSMIKHIHSILRNTVNVKEESHFRLLLGEQVVGDKYWQRHDVVGWEIVSAHQVLQEDAASRIQKFVKDYDLSLKEICKLYAGSAIEQNPSIKEEAAALAKTLCQKGYKLTAIPVRGLLSDLSIVHDAEFEKARLKFHKANPPSV